MKAIQVFEFGGPEVMQYKEIPTPKPQAAEVLVKIHAVGVNPVDTYIRAGGYSFKPALPFTPGFDGAGTIEVLGANVKGVKPGERVYCSGSVTGTYAEFAICKTTQVHTLPEHLSFEQGAAVNVAYTTAWRALFQRAQGKSGDTVLVHGASGGVGTAAIQIAKMEGLRAIGTAGTERGLKLVQESGAALVCDHKKPGYLAEILNWTGGKGVNIILEMLANVNLNNDLSLLAFNGRVVVIGSRGKIEIDPRLTMGKDAAILGMSLSNLSEEDKRKIHSALGARLKNRSLNPVVGKKFKLAEAAKAHVAVMEPGAYGKIVMVP